MLRLQIEPRELSFREADKRVRRDAAVELLLGGHPARILDAMHHAHVLGVLRVLYHRLALLELLVRQRARLLRPLAGHQAANRARGPKPEWEEKQTDNRTTDADPAKRNSRRLSI